MINIGRWIVPSFILFIWVTNLFAVPVIQKIKITGNKRIETDAIVEKLLSKEKEPYFRSNIREDIERIFRMGYFDDIQVDYKLIPPDQVVLTFKVHEMPAISEIQYEGLSEIEKKDLEEEAEIKPYSILNINKINVAIEKMLKHYEEKGFYLAQIDYRIEKAKKPDEIKLIFEIQEHDKVRVKKINFLGNNVFKDDDLKTVMQTKEGGFFSWLTGSGSYKETVFERDIQVLNYFYWTHGYVQIKIEKPVIAVSPDKKWVYVTIALNEGVQFFVGEVDFQGELLFKKEELTSELALKKDDVFNSDILRQEILKYTDKYGDLGYAFANVIPRTSIREKERRVDIIFEVDKGNKVYWGQYTVIGNTKTRDKVVRREMKIKEGELYHGTKKRKSRERVERLGFFSEVIFNQKPRKDRKDVLDLEIKVKERSTGTLTVGAGYSSMYGFLIQGQVSQNNLFGRGQILSVSANLSFGKEGTKRYDLSFTEPYLLDTVWSFGFDFYNTERPLEYAKEIKFGGDIRLGHPIPGMELTYIYLTYKVESIDLQDIVDPVIVDPDSAKGLTSSLITTLVRDSRNNRFEPTRGSYYSLSAEYAGLGGDKRFTKGIANARWYLPVVWQFVFKTNLSMGVITSNSSKKSVPVNEKFIIGGINTLRGYSNFSIGPRRYSPVQNREVPIGGNKQIIMNAEFEVPIIKEAGIKAVIFGDYGAAFNTWSFGEPGSEPRGNWGFGFRWFSPIGPLRFEWGIPIAKRSHEDSPLFQFSIGPPF